MQTQEEFFEMLNSLSEEEVKAELKKLGIPQEVLNENRAFLTCQKEISKINNES